MNASFVDSPLLGVAISLPIIASVCVVLRLCAKRWRRRDGFTGDDWTILLTLILCWGHSINTIVAACLGGVNTITIPPREYANMALRTLWISSFFLITSLYTVKVSILLFYWRMFSINARFRKACLAMIITLTLWWISSLILVFLSTDPIDSAWKDATRAKHRFDFNTWYISYSALSIFFDVVILCFPIPVIKSLRVNLKRKISIIGIFWLGGFVCVSAIIRFVLLYRSIYRLTDYGENQYSSITQAFIWAEIEPNTSVIAACLPTYGPLFKEGGLVPFIWQSVRSSLGLSSGTGRDTGRSATGDTTAVGYYELDKVTSYSKSGGDILTDKATTNAVTVTSQSEQEDEDAVVKRDLGV
ncbi:hypothetical protein K458DRAFT_358875 [Lentithecium fluviatile CBS 122367]|uniref:Rhodopsin domain-containing protein n=1 Tax=Lentithecium fluviatile CBS 122367 TaxID=1168545 RepID=A0A6G1JHV0_9PLEO|nr:hypothetical protein K458DRAFT_358875 [Lentithecium fluviatile CBS 122367]